MRLLPAGRRTSRALLLFLAIALLAQISAAQDTTDANDAATTDDATAAATSAETTDTGTSTTDSSTSSSTDSSTTSSSSSTSSSYPTVTVPPTAGAPYMQTSSTPEGAVFIAVGAVLGFLGLAVLAWRGLVAWSVNRSVRQQAAAMQSSEKRGLLRSRRSSARSKSRSRSRSMPREHLPSGNMNNTPTGNANGGGYDRHHHRRRSGSGSRGPPRMREIPGSSNALFFSPTAGASMHSGKRSSQHHSGYGYGYGYGTASTSTPRASTGPIPTSASLSASERYQPPYKGKRAYPPPPPRARNIPIVSPPVSPNLRPTGTGGYMGPGRSRPLSGDSMSSGSVNPNQASPPRGRAPSEYLEDLFDGRARPGPDWDRR